MEDATPCRGMVAANSAEDAAARGPRISRLALMAKDVSSDAVDELGEPGTAYILELVSLRGARQGGAVPLRASWGRRGTGPPEPFSEFGHYGVLSPFALSGIPPPLSAAGVRSEEVRIREHFGAHIVLARVFLSLAVLGNRLEAICGWRAFLRASTGASAGGNIVNAS